MLVHDRFPGLQPHLDGPCDAGPVARIALLGSGRVDPAQQPVNVFGSVLFANAVEALAKRIVSWGTYEQGLTERSQVKTGAADEYRDATTAFNLFDLIRRLACPLAGGVVDVGRNKVDQMVGNSLALLEGHFSGRDLDLLIDLDRIAIDNLAVDFEGNFNPESAFS